MNMAKKIGAAGDPRPPKPPHNTSCTRRHTAVMAAGRASSALTGRHCVSQCAALSATHQCDVLSGRAATTSSATGDCRCIRAGKLTHLVLPAPGFNLLVIDTENKVGGRRTLNPKP